MKKTTNHLSMGVLTAKVLALLALVIVTLANPMGVRASALCYVNAAVVGGANNGSSWTNAYTDLQSALGTSTCTEVWVATGTYKPTNGTDRNTSFLLKNDVGIYGGFAGWETLLNQRNPVTNVTTLSGEINNTSDTSDNSYHVVTTVGGIKSTAVLDGFTVTGGYAVNGSIYSGEGAGMFNDTSNPTLANLRFYNNSAQTGGGMSNYRSNPTLTNVIFDHNTVTNDAGGMFNDTSNPTLTNVTFDTNSALNDGGGMYNYSTSSPPLLTNVTFSGNSASDGGAMYNYSSSPTLTNVTFSGNSATASYPTAGGMVNKLFSNPTIYDSIFWPKSDKIFNNSSTPFIVDSIIYDGCPNPPGPDCTNIINSDPHLGPLANNGGYTKTMALGADSSAIDAGGVNCATKDQRGVNRPQGVACDIGAFEVRPPSLTSMPTSWNYGLVKIGTTSTGKVFTIKNTGDAKFVIGTVKLAGINTGSFHLTVNNCSGHTLLSNGTCSITAKFNPSTAIAKTAYINIPDNAAGHLHKIQLSGKGATEQSLNGGFNTYAGTSKVPTNWVAANFASADGKDTVTKKEGTASVWIRNTAAKTKTLTQTRLVSGATGSTFVLSLWGKGQSIPATAGVVQAQVLLYNAPTLLQTKTITIGNGTYGFTQKSLPFTATHAYNKIVIKLIYSKGSGSIWFDGLSLLRSP